jgi:predicted ATPase/class 3 adenylate cyclase
VLVVEPQEEIVRPSGTVTFLFTDVEGSTRLWAADTDAMSASLLVHDRILRTTFESQGGYVFTTAGDSFAVAFARASDAVAAAATVQQELAAESWPGPALRVRMGIHLGEAEERGGDYFGPVVNTAARVEAAGHGGQVLITDAVRATAGVEASDLGAHQLRDVDEPIRLFQLGDGEFAPLRVVDAALTNLPSRPTRLIGRDDEVSRVRQLLADNRLVTITAVGGSGKTRLAIAVGEAELRQRPDGVWFVDLTAVMSGDDVPAAIANAVGLVLMSAEPTEKLIEFLSSKTALVILDNCEHVVDECAEFVESALAVRGDVSFLATSRELLDVEGERTVPLRTLPCDSADSAGVRLFLDRATALDPGFELTDENADTISTLCSRLDGMPLAIELAAARITVLSPSELLSGLDDRFQLLAGGRRRQRQRTLEATLDWSYDLLDSDEQQVFRTLGVFVDGFDLAAVAAVANVTHRSATALIEALIAKSLVARTEHRNDSRFRLLETVKAYAEDRLVDANAARDARDAHLAHFHQIANINGRACGAEIRNGVELHRDRSNITSAFEWAASTQQWTMAGELIIGARGAYDVYGHMIEVRSLLERALDNCPVDDSELADGLRNGLAFPCGMLSDWAAFARHSSALADSRNPTARAWGANLLAWLALHSEPARAEAVLTQAQAAVDEARQHDPGRGARITEALLHDIRGLHAAGAGNFVEALRHLHVALKIQEESDFYYHHRVQSGLHLAGVCQVILGMPAQALDTVAEVDTYGFALFDGADVRTLAHLEMGEIDTAMGYLRTQVARGRTGLFPGEANDSVLLLAALAHAEGDIDTARELLLQIGMCRTDATIIFSHELARRLELTDEHEEGQRQSLTFGSRSPEGITGMHLAMTALRDELTRRNWD